MERIDLTPEVLLKLIYFDLQAMRKRGENALTGSGFMSDDKAVVYMRHVAAENQKDIKELIQLIENNLQ